MHQRPVDGEITPKRLTSAAIDDRAIADHEIVHRILQARDSEASVHSGRKQSLNDVAVRGRLIEAHLREREAAIPSECSEAGGDVVRDRGEDSAGRIDRRSFLRLGGSFALLTLAPFPLLAELVQRTRETGTTLFFGSWQLETLRALCGRLIPGPPEDPDPGALEAGVPEYIDLLLGAFKTTPVPIFAGGPFSMRHGGGHNHFLDFLPLDALEERAWRTRIEGSRGIPEREWNGPVTGWQERYTRGLNLLEQAADRWGDSRFAELSPRRSRWILRMAQGELGEFVDLAFEHTIEGMYGAPEYGGNRNGVGWSYTRWPGDRQPLTYSNREVSEVDPEEREAEERALRNAEEHLGIKIERG